MNTNSDEHDLAQEKSYQEHPDQDGRKSPLTTRIKQYGVVVRAYLKHSWPIFLVSFFTFLNGVSSIAIILVTRVPERAHFLLPFGLYHWTRSLTLVVGFVLIYLSYYLLKRRRIAWWIAVFAAGIETVAHLIHLHLWYTALAPLITFILLIVFRHRFAAHSEFRNIKIGIGLFLASILTALLYGTIGFWMLDKRDFGLNFSLTNALLRTIKEFTLLGNSDLVAKSREASWFLRSLDILGIVAGIFAIYSLFRPIISRLVEVPLERARAKEILKQHGRSTYDYFKVWPDKSYFFSESKRSFISYRCVTGVAFCLGDPVGPEDETESVIRGFLNLCYQNGWAAVFLLPEQPALQPGDLHS